MDRVALDPATQITAHMLLERHKVELVPVSKDWVAAKAQVLLQDAASDLDLVLHASPEVDEFYTVFHVWLPHKLHAKVFSLHDGDYVEVTGAYAGEVGLLQQPQIYGETVELITAAPPGPHK